MAEREKLLLIILINVLGLLIYQTCMLQASRLHHQFAMRTLEEVTTAQYRCQSVVEQCCR